MDLMGHRISNEMMDEGQLKRNRRRGDDDEGDESSDDSGGWATVGR